MGTNPVIDLVMDGHYLHSRTGKCYACDTAFPCGPIFQARRLNAEAAQRLQRQTFLATVVQAQR